MDAKLIQRFEDVYILACMGDFFTREIKSKQCSIVFNDELPDDPYLNYATKIEFKKDAKGLVKEIEDIFIVHKSIPSFYILPYTKPNSLQKHWKKWVIRSLERVPLCFSTSKIK